MKPRIFQISAFIMGAVLFASLSTAQATMYAAGATRSITPPDLSAVCLGGYDLGRPAENVHDEIKARAFALKDNAGTEIYLVSLDLVGFLSNRIDMVKEALAADGIPRDNIIISSTHTHSAPDGVGLWGGGCHMTGPNPTYLSLVVTQCIDVVRECRQNFQPVRIRFGKADGTGLTNDTRDPDNLDQDVVVMQAVNMSDQVVATLVNYGAHPTISPGNDISADFCYYLNGAIESAYSGVSTFITGSEGAVYPDTFGDSFEESQRWGEGLASLAIQSLNQATLYDDLEITVIGRRVGFVLENELFRAGSATGLFEWDYVTLEANGWQIPTDVAYITFGNVASLCTGPGELFPEVGMELKSVMPGTFKFLPNMANNQLGYFIPYSDYEWPRNPFDPGDHYHETTSAGSMLAPLLLQTLFEMMGAPTPTPVVTHTPNIFTPTPTRTPRPTRTPTPGGTDTPAPTSTPTPVPPKVTLAGYWDSALTSGAGGTISLVVLVDQPVSTVHMGDGLLPFMGEGTYGVMGVAVSGGLPSGKNFFTIWTDDLSSVQSPFVWPYLNVVE